MSKTSHYLSIVVNIVVNPNRNNKRRTRRLVLAASALAVGTLLAANPARADIYQWDTVAGDSPAITDGPGTWTAGAGNWYNATTSSHDQNWADGNVAQFGTGASGTGGAVAISGTVSATDVIFNKAWDNSSYSLTGGTLNLTGGATMTTDGATNAVASTITGNAGLTKLGAGTLQLSGTDTYTGETRVPAGTLKLMATGTLSAVAGRIVTVSGGGILDNNGQGYIIGNGVSNNKLTVTGSGSKAQNNYNIQVGTGSANSNNNTLEVLNGGYASVNSSNGFFVGNSGGDSNRATIDGQGSQMMVGWPGSGTPVRIYGNNGALTVSNGGYMYSSWQFNIGGTGYGNGNTLTVTDPGSSLYDGGPMLLSRQSSNNKVVVRNGGLLTLGGNITINEKGGGSGTLTITDAGSKMIVDSGAVASNNTSCVVNLSSGGYLSTTTVSGGYLNLGDGNLGSDGSISTVTANNLAPVAVNFNKGKLIAKQDNTALITGSVTLNGPAYIDTASYADTIAVSMGGAGGLTKNSCKNNLADSFG